jgi:hypothetical protein
MTAGSLRDQLYADRVPLGEFRIILTSHLDEAQENGDSILYKKEGRPALSLAYTKKGGLLNRVATSSIER